ncbi:biotin carboxylase N-terminal domain-containing protein [Microbacterium horticulturae]|uniref:biotin carboxylase n=1 Tax=Microbacterium horticulturae TaxID=3028316 RepID=A0ABY8C2G9_9MICO|nr:biotin carboxylase N-terminal domain-containing protein [Microbacterium sp. KACC 23027]WEG10645.1 biotin carboxylase N-terminal domain-containing protein [Microbacterium sp. KACC 23027]
MYFDTVLVANRGEIARRVIRTLRLLGIRSVAVYSDADASAPHVAEADDAVRIGPAAASHSYLDIDAVIGAAQASGAQAIHPGYGFLSENPALGRACAEAGIVFIGPGAQALEVMADKIRARDHVAASGVPIVPGFSAAGMTDDEIVDAAKAAGFPLLIKPSAGGGGKGMQEVHGPDEVRDAVATARRVATAAFGDDTLLFERLIQRPRHIEVQVLGDTRGTVIHLGERECTLQRRHQKVIEEAPSPLIDAGTRARLGEAACAAAASVAYTGAGTVEFIVSADRPDEFFFMEMNTRLQVEHPVTELVTGVDLVEQQLRIAAGEALDIADVTFDGHAIEARVYAESPARGFLPATGDVLLWQPAEGVRTDAAVETGSVVTADYDPMIAKVIAHGADRAQALERLDAALAGTVLFGVESNIDFLRTLLTDPVVQAGDMDTGLIDRMPPFEDPAPNEAALAAAAAAVPLAEERGHATPLWLAGTGWRASAAPVPGRVWFETSDGTVSVAPRAQRDEGPVTAVGSEGTVWVHADGVTSALTPLTRRQAMEHRLAQRERAEGASDPELRAPMPGAVVAVHAEEGARVTAGEKIVSIEAMKMEHPVTAPHDGILTLLVASGDQVRRDQIIARVDPAEGE